MRFRYPLVAALAAASLLLAGCGDDESSAPTGSNTAEQFNDADVSFAQDMIVHHRQAIAMATLAADRAESQEVKDLAAGIEAAQDPEIETMTGWLETWDEDVPEEMDGDMGGMDHGAEMPGMMTQEELDELTNATGTEFDQMFLTMMIEHHQGAIEMAQMEQSDGENPDAIALAKQIQTAQESEVKTMEQLLGS